MEEKRGRKSEERESVDGVVNSSPAFVCWFFFLFIFLYFFSSFLLFYCCCKVKIDDINYLMQI